MQNMYLDLTY